MRGVPRRGKIIAEVENSIRCSNQGWNFFMPDAFTYSLVKFDADSLAETRKGWEKQLKEHSKELLASDFERILDWAEKHASYDANSTGAYAYGVFNGSSKSAEAIVEIAYRKEGKKWLKV